MIKKFKSWLNIVFLTLVLVIPGFVFATSTTSVIKDSASPLDRLENTATTYGPYTAKADETTLATTLGVLINTVLSILGVIFIFIIILAGYQWMTAQGNEQSVTKAKDSMTRAIIGLIIVISSYAIWTFIKTTFIAKI
jgi:hypothetical protein